MDIEIRLSGGKKVDAHIKDHVIKTDQPVNSGGEGTAPSPFDLFLASIGTCAGVYLKSFCDQRNIPTEKIKIIQQVESDPISNMVNRITLVVDLPSDFPEKYKGAMIQTMNLCKVKRHLAQAPVVEIKTITA